MRYVELFAGAGGLSLGLDAAGWQCVAHAEIEPHARAVLRYRWPAVPLHGDVTQIDGTQWRGLVDVVSGGSPCQDLSVAGKRAGLVGARSSLFHEQVRIWTESGAPHLIWENVGGALSSNQGKDFATVLGTIIGAGVDVPLVNGKPKWQRAGRAVGPTAVAAWRVLDLQHFGPAQRRVRVFIVASRTGGVDPAEILALREGVCGHPAPRSQAREGVTGTISARTKGGGGLGTGFDLSGGIVAFDTTQITSPLNYSNQKAGDPCHPLAAKGHPPVIAFAMRGREGGAMPEVNTDGAINTLRGASGGSTRDMVVALHASEDGTGCGTPIVVLSHGQANAEVSFDIVPTLTTLHEAPITVVGALDTQDGTKWGSNQWVNQGKCLAHLGRPRRLMPIECERLMGWPDFWTATGTKEDGTEYALSDTARYRLVGNGVGAPCAAWIASRFHAAQIAEIARAA